MEQEILQRRLIRFLVGDVFHTISEDDILRKVGEDYWNAGKPLTKGQVELLKKEALAFSKTSLNKILIAEIRYYARQSLEKAETEADIISAKLLGYFADVLESKLKKIINL